MKVLNEIRTSSLSSETVELIFVDDGSEDGTLGILRQLVAENSSVKYLSFSRNFGKESAILASLKAATGDYAAVMDADLQDPPSLLPEMLKAVREKGYDCAGTRHVTRKGEPPIRSFFARLFYRTINWISDTKLVDGSRDYKLMSRPVVNALLSMPEYHRFSKGLFEWVVVFTTAPLIMVSLRGIFFMLASFVSILFLCSRHIFWHESVSGWTSLACILIFFCGLQLFSLGILDFTWQKTTWMRSVGPSSSSRNAPFINHCSCQVAC